MYLQDFINKYNGKALDRDGYYGAQCMDLYNQFQDEVLNVQVKGAACAKDVWSTYDTNVFDKITNTPSFVPKLGDVAVWGPMQGNSYGHIAICTGKGNVNNFESFDQNWGGQYCHFISHNYFNGFYGVLRPKDQSKIAKPVDNKLGYYKVTASQGLNLRASYTILSKKLGGVPKGTILNIVDTYKGQLYFWGKTDKGYWVALSSGTEKI